jgi:type II secretory ATPase GspE/PulE/Tfp pilus assembly ATPase PilB-like protein
MTPEDRLLQFLICNGAVPHSVTPEEITAKHTGPLRILASHGKCKQEEALRLLEEHFGFESFALSEINAATIRKIPTLLEKLPSEFCRNHRLIPLVEHESSLDVAFSNPFDVDAVKILEFIFNKTITIKLALEEDILSLINRFQFNDKFEFDDMLPTDQDESIEIVGELSLGEDIEVTSADAPPIIKLANRIIDDAVVAKASDIHIELGYGGVVIRYRIDGIMQHVFEAPRRYTSALITRLKLLASLNIAEHRRTQDGRMRVKMGDHAVDIRVSTVPTAHGEKIVLRLLRSNLEEMTFPTLSLPNELEAAIKDDLSQYGKLLLVTGPTGSGKLRLSTRF